MSFDPRTRFAKTTQIVLVALALAITPTFAADGVEPWAGLGIEMDGSWQELTPGVYQRATLSGIESRAFGTDGLAWGLDQMEAELVHLTRRFIAEPSDTYRGHLEAHLGAITELQGELHRRANGRTQEKRASAPPCNSYVIYSADADAGVDPSEVWATADAQFSVVHNFGPYCPGTAYARAYAETTSGSFVFSDSDTCSQTNIVANCSVSASIFNSSNCNSDSYAYASYPSWGYFTSQSAVQIGCM